MYISKPIYSDNSEQTIILIQENVTIEAYIETLAQLHFI